MNDLKLKETLGNIGLKKNEVKIYLNLLGDSTKTVNKIALENNLPKSTVYDNLYKLLEKNLVLEDKKSRIKKYEARNPIYLRSILNNLQTKHEAALNFLFEIAEDVNSAILSLSNRVNSDSLENIAMAIPGKFHKEKWEELRDLLYKIPLPSLIVLLGNEFTNIFVEEVSEKFPENKILQLTKLELLKHRGEFKEFVTLDKQIKHSVEAQILYLEYLNIIGEKPKKSFIANLKSEVFVKNIDKNLLDRFKYAYIEFLWIHEHIEIATEEVQKYLKQTDDQIAIAKFQFLLGELYRHRGMYKKALKLYEQSLVVLEPTHNKREVALLYKSMSVCYRNIDRWTLAFEYVSKAVKISREFGDKSLIARTVLSLGSFNEIRKNNTVALKLHREAFSLGKQMDSIRDIFYAGQNIAITLLKLHRVEEALEYFQKAYQSAEKLNRAYYFDMWIGFIEVVENNNYKHGLRLIKKALKTAKERGEEKRIDIANSLLGSAYYIKGIDKDKGEDILQKLSDSTSSNVIRTGIEEVFSGVSFWDSRLCS